LLLIAPGGERGANLVEARPAGGLDEHYVTGGKVAARPVDGRVVAGQRHSLGEYAASRADVATVALTAAGLQRHRDRRAALVRALQTAFVSTTVPP
jgi:hypothetical protein